MKKSKINKKLYFILIPSILVSLLVGIYIGMVLQQMIIGALMVSFGESLAGTNIEFNVDFNESLLVDGFKENLNLFVKELNQSKSLNKGLFCNAKHYACVMHDQNDYTSHGLEWSEEQLIKSIKVCERFCYYG